MRKNYRHTGHCFPPPFAKRIYIWWRICDCTADEEKYVNQLKWIEEEEMLNMIAIAQSSPGPIAVNTAIMVGYKIAGVLGAALSTIGTVLPPLIILTVVSFFYQEFRDNMYISAMLKGMQAGVSAVIVDVVIGLSGNVIKKKRFFLLL